MIRHILLVKMKEGVKALELSAVEDAFMEIPAKIEGVVSVEWGVNNSPEEKSSGFTHAIVMTFNSEQSRSVYLDHPEHLKLKSVFRPVIEQLLVFDYSVKV